jgi:hypothetical protein
MDDKLRPLTLGEILDRTAQFYRRNFWTFAGVAAVPVLASFAVLVPIGVAMGLMGVFKAGQAAANTPAFVGMIVVAVAIGLPVLLVAGVVEQAALTRTAIGVHLGQKLKVREAIRSVWPRFWRYLWLLVLLGLLVGFVPFMVAGGVAVGTIGLGAAGGAGARVFSGFLTFLLILGAFVYIVWRWLCYAMAMAACIVEEKTAWQSIRRANRLSKGTRWRIFVMYLLMFAISFVIAMIADVFMFIGIAIATALGSSKLGPVVTVVGVIIGLLARIALQVIIQPIPGIALVLFYYDQRVRTEGYDIELMMEQAGMTSPPIETAPPANPEAQAEPASGLLAIESPLTPSFEPGAGPDTVKEQ